MTSFWHPFADMFAVESAGPLVLARGEGVRVWDTSGREYLDATAGLWFANVGFGRDEIGEAAAAQMALLPSYSTFGDLSNEPVELLAERVASIAPIAGSRVFFTSGGSDSVDTATKIARRFWQLSGQQTRTVFIARQHAYHGMHTAGTSLAGIPANVEGYGDLLAEVERVPWNDSQALRDKIGEIGAERVAAFFCEPVVGAGGVFSPPEGYLDEVREICRETGVLFIADEVITGFGRAGDWFASRRFDLKPDLITCAKGITSGYLPLGAVVAAPRVADVFWAQGSGMFRHGYTYSGHAAVAAAALANLDIMDREGLLGRALELETLIPQALSALADHPRVEEIRGGIGALAAVQLDTEHLAKDPTLAAKAVMECREQGVLTRALATGALQVSPALVIDEASLERLAEGISAALSAL